MFRLIFTQLKKLLYSPLFYCSVLGVALLCMFSSIHNNLDQTGKGDVILYCLTNYSRQKMLTDISFSSFNVFCEGGNGYWMHLFIPVLVTIAAVNIYCDEGKSRERRFAIFRTGRWKYYAGNILFFLIAGAIVAGLGYLLFGLFTNVCFPHRSAYLAEELQEYTQLKMSYDSFLGRMYAEHGMKFVYFLKLLSFCMYGMVSAVPALVLAAFVKNKYLITCIPFFIGDVLRQISRIIGLQRVGIDVTDEKSARQIEHLTELSQIISPDSIADVFALNGTMLFKIFIVNASVIVAGIILAFYIMGLGVDKGE